MAYTSVIAYYKNLKTFKKYKGVKYTHKLVTET